MTEDKGKQRRKYPRCDVNKWVVCNFNGESEISIASIKNLSGGGLCILTEKEPREGEIISMELSIPGEFLPTSVEGEVRWVHKLRNPEGKFRYSVGILFQNPREKDRLNIINMVTKYLKRQAGAEKPSVAAKERKKMLAIDEDEIVLSSVKDIFGAKFNLFTTQRSEVALKMAEKNKPDIILLDVDMKMDDDSFLFKKIKSDPDMAGIPLVLISKFGKTELVEEALRAGALDFLMTPGSIRRIMDMAGD